MTRLISVTALIVLLLWGLAYAVGVEPVDRRPGTRLAGDVVAMPTDWSFTDSVMEVHLETYPWYGIPFSVTTVLARDGDALFVPSLYDGVMEFPGSKFWNKVVVGNSDVRLRVGDQLFEMTIAPITNPQEFERAFVALGEKYPFWAKMDLPPEPERTFALLRLRPR